jgi:hypothetical protein
MRLIVVSPDRAISVSAVIEVSHARTRSITVPYALLIRLVSRASIASRYVGVSSSIYARLMEYSVTDILSLSDNLDTSLFVQSATARISRSLPDRGPNEFLIGFSFGAQRSATAERHRRLKGSELRRIGRAPCEIRASGQACVNDSRWSAGCP